MSTLSNDILSKIIVYTKYARFLKDKGRRETFEEIVDRVKNMHLKKYPQAKELIEDVIENFVKARKVLPSMRSMQFAGVPIERNPSRIYNCAFLPIEHPDAFSETMFLLLGGTGVGYSVQSRHVGKLPIVKGTKKRSRRYVIGDSIEGWSDAVKVLVESFFYGRDAVRYDYDDIRKKNTELVTSGGKAPGPEPLRVCLAKVEGVLANAVGRQLTPLEAHDILCYLADAVLAGGIRRAAMIALFSADDDDMLNCKSGDWFELNPQRGRANNSVVLHRKETTMKQFQHIWERVQASGSGEPGISWTNNYDWGYNPLISVAA